MQNSSENNSHQEFGIRRIVNRLYDDNNMYYDEVSYNLISLWEIVDEDDPLEGDWECNLFDFVYCHATNSIINLEAEIDEVDPSEDENFLFSELDNLFKIDVEQYGKEIERLIEIEKIKSIANEFINKHL